MNGAELRMMVVDDHAFQRNTLMRVLTSMGAMHVVGAADGRAALEIVRTLAPPIDIIVSDLDMPDMDGMEFMRHLGAAGVPVSVILASAVESSLLASVETMARAYGVRVLGVIQKPVTPAKLEPLMLRHQAYQPAVPRAVMQATEFSLRDILAGLDRDEFEPFFQPKVDLASKDVRGAEALARWRHPRHGVVGPHAFIELLEQNGQIDVLTWAMLRKAAAFCRDWRVDSGLDVTVSVNLSVASLADVQVANRITELVRAEGLDPHHMVLEVTESAATTQVALALETLSRLRMKGFGLSIDDYGTGYSSMQQLTRIAFTELKIDQSFVAEAARQQSARVILESSLDMARKLGISSVAEGVETQDDWDLLRTLGCQVAQGYLVARPMEASAVQPWTVGWGKIGIRALN